MTYQQVFDEAIGDLPASTVDVERVIGRQRRARRLRLGAAGAAVVAAVLAVALGTNVLVAPNAKAPVTDVSPAPTTIPGTPEDLNRIDAAVVAALVRAEPRLVWSADGVDSGTTPNWQSEAGGAVANAAPDAGYRGHGSIRVGAGEVRVSVGIERDGALMWERLNGCDGRSAPQCVERTGPRGEQITIVQDAYEGEKVPERLKGKEHSSGETMHVRAIRPDGSFIEVGAYTADGKPRLPVTADQMVAVAVDGAITLAPLPSASPAPSSTVTTIAGTDEDGERLGNALTAALRRQAAGFTWVTGWGGPVSRGPVWMDKGHVSVDVPYLGHASFRIGDRGGRISLGLVRDGRTAWEYASPCPTAGLAARNCTVSEGPTGEKIRARHLVADLGRAGALHRPALSSLRRVEVLRPDGTYLFLAVSGGETVLSMAQLTDVARDPALAIAPPPPPGTKASRGSGPPADFDMGVGSAAAAAALDDVVADGTIFLRMFRGGRGGPTGTGLMSFSFLVQREGMAGDGEILVQRRVSATLSCATVRTLPAAHHPRHQHAGECAESTRPDGNRVITVVSRSSGLVTYTAFVQRPDRGMVEVVLDNRPNTGAATDMPEGGQMADVWPKNTKGGAAPPLTLEQVVELATHPDLVNLLP
ncbi:hypothetical protein [Micromonospora sp. NPDC049497]|uniref:hypothetical protein n=1 Tax=Micromonospora sp. NPDC049497 TaxID=3364273 RepID=UPI0037A49E3C